MNRLVTALSRWSAPLAVGALIGVMLGGAALAEFDILGQCAVKPVHLVVEGEEKTPWHFTLPDGNPGALICGGRTYVPVRWVGESLGKIVTWDPASYTVELSGSNWSKNGVNFNIAQVQVGSTGTAVTVNVSNTSDQPNAFTFTVNFNDGAGRRMGSVQGPKTHVLLGAGESKAVTAVSQADLSGYVSLSVTPQVTPAGLHPTEARTGVAEVDRVIEAIVNRDDDRLGQLIAMTKVACQEEPGDMAAEPPCPQKIADGTPIDVFPASTCQPNYMFSAADAHSLITDSLREPANIYAVYRTSSIPFPGGGPGYGIVAATSLDDQTAQTFYVSEQGEVRMLLRGCGTADAATPREADFLMAPLRQW